MLRKAALALLAAGSPLLLAAFVLGGRWADWVLAALAAAFPLALAALGGPARRLRLWLAALLLLLEGCLLGSLALSGEAGRGPWFGGLPAATALLVYGAGLAALLLTGLAYAATFSAEGRR